MTKKTLIVSAFPGCGKTFLYEAQNATFSIYGTNKTISFIDSDSSSYSKTPDWEYRYALDIKSKLGTVDFIFISQHAKVLEELHKLGIDYVTIYPNNTDELSDKERMLIKQQWFGRFVLRDNSHIKDFSKWLSALKENYDNWTSIEQIKKMKPLKYYLLNQNQYTSDILDRLYILKETL